MLGRALIPLILKDGDKEIQVKEVEELKRLFNTENLPRFLSALDSGKLEQFFFAKRLDHIKEKIAQMRQNGEDAIDILNYVAEQIGAEKLSISFEKANLRSLTENFTEEDQELYLILSSYSLTESSIKGNKKLIGALEEPNTVKIEVKTDKLTGKNLFLKNVVLEFKEDFKFEGFEFLSFENVKFESKRKIVFTNLKVDLKNCHFNTLVEFNNCEVDIQESTFSMSEIGGLNMFNSKGKLAGCKVLRNELKEESNDILFYVKDSELNIEGTEVFRDNKASTTNGVVIENSSVSLRECKVYGFMNGIITLNSKLKIVQSEIFENSATGILVAGSPEFEVEDSAIYKNSEVDENNQKDLMQVCIINSKALIEDSKIHNSKGGIGIVLLSSKATIKNCEVFKNLRGGIYSNKLESDTQMAKAVLSNLGKILSDKSELFKANEIEPEVEIENCNIYDNHGGRWAQVNIINSKLKISNSNVYSYISKTGTGIYIDGSPEATLYNCKIYENDRDGVNIKNSPEVNIEHCDIYDNGFSGSYPQIWIETSKVLIENSKVWMETKNIKNHRIYGIYIKSGAALLYKVSTWGHYYYDIFGDYYYYGIYSEQRFALALYECDVKDGVNGKRYF